VDSYLQAITEIYTSRDKNDFKKTGRQKYFRLTVIFPLMVRFVINSEGEKTGAGYAF